MCEPVWTREARNHENERLLMQIATAVTSFLAPVTFRPMTLALQINSDAVLLTSSGQNNLHI
jgi:hypothetical protein